jgi:hypothetical protein
MVRSVTSLAAAAVLAATAVAPAHAEVVGINSCAATAVTGARGSCVFVAQPGTYTIEIIGTGRYSWADVHCNQQQPSTDPPYLFVDAWDADGGFDTERGPLPGGVCTLRVAASDHASGSVHL